MGDLMQTLIVECGVSLPTCGKCREWIDSMNGWGISGCIQHRAEIEARLVEASTVLSWLDMIRVATHGYLTVASMVDEVIRRGRKVAGIVFPFTGTPTRHLIGHLWPHQWEWQVGELLKRIETFNGVRSIGVVTDESTSTLEEVQRRFSGVRIDNWIHLRNDPKQREGVTFFPLMETLPNGPDDITWYWHGKGAQYDGEAERSRVTKHWAEVQWRIMLDGWERVQAALERHPITGCFKRRDGWQLTQAHPWHYSGTAWAFRNREVFSRNWRRLSRYFHCVEFWPSMVFSDMEAGCVFGDGASDLYQRESWKEWDLQLGVQP